MRLRHVAYLIWQIVWGFPQTIAGACTFLAYARNPHFFHHGAVVTIWKPHYGLSLGPFVFLNAWDRETAESLGVIVEGEGAGADSGSVGRRSGGAGAGSGSVGGRSEDTSGAIMSENRTGKASGKNATKPLDETPVPTFVEYRPGAFLDDRLLVHEYGHTIQSLILGPFYLIVIGLPSVIWLKTPRLAKRRQSGGSSYYKFYTEHWANHLGEKVLKRSSMGMAFIG